MKHPDPMDNATATEELFRGLALAQRRPGPLPETGYCHNCREALAEGRFCDSDCRDDYDLRVRLDRIKGVIDEMETG